MTKVLVEVIEFESEIKGGVTCLFFQKTENGNKAITANDEQLQFISVSKERAEDEALDSYRKMILDSKFEDGYELEFEYKSLEDQRKEQEENAADPQLAKWINEIGDIFKKMAEICMQYEVAPTEEQLGDVKQDVDDLLIKEGFENVMLKPVWNDELNNIVFTPENRQSVIFIYGLGACGGALQPR